MSEDALFKTHSSNSLRDGLGESLQQQERESERAEMSADRGQWPMWVRFGLWKVPSARAANAYRFFSGLIAVGAGIAGFQSPRFFLVAAAMGAAALWYWLAARWVERHGGW